MVGYRGEIGERMSLYKSIYVCMKFLNIDIMKIILLFYNFFLFIVLDNVFVLIELVYGGNLVVVKII